MPVFLTPITEMVVRGVDPGAEVRNSLLATYAQPESERARTIATLTFNGTLGRMLKGLVGILHA